MPHNQPRLQLLSGWGRTPASSATVHAPRTADEVAELLARPGPRGVLPRGLGRSYGDAALNAGGDVLDMTGLRSVRELDAEAGTITVSGGTSLGTLMKALLPLGWFVPVTPGTRYVTVGGAIAADIHGKNHHQDGGFCDHVTSIKLLSPTGMHDVTAKDDNDLFGATAGGMGLTGIVLEATLRLLPVTTAAMSVDTERANDLDEAMHLMESGDDAYRYSVAWVDSLARGRRLGRSVLTRANHASIDELGDKQRSDPLAYGPRVLLDVPPWTPGGAINRISARAFNELWFRKSPRTERGTLQSITSYFHPLDAIKNWNRLYGPRGFLQYQLVVPTGAEDVLRRVLERMSAGRYPSLVSVLKRMGPGRGLLSFPISGWTLTLDIPAGIPGLGSVLDSFDELVASAGGRVYLAKDSRTRPEIFEAMYPELDRWREIKQSLDPAHVLRSDLDRRLGLSEHH